MTDPQPANAAQIESWNARTGLRWAALQERIDAMFAPLTAALIDHAAPRTGERVLDVGCGCGATVLALAQRVGPQGSVLGVDVSEPMLAVARRRVAEQGVAAGARLLQADAAAYPFAHRGTDLAASRFGVMFFDDPVAAFRNIRTALVPGGRLVFACWQPLAANDWFREPVEAVLPLLGPLPPADPDAPGPFAFARPDRVRAILADAGWSDVDIVPHATTVWLGGAGEVADTAVFVTQVGAAARMLAEAAPEVVAAARTAIAARLARFDTADGIVLGGATWFVSARA